MTGGASPLLAHALHCPPHGRWENGASGKFGASPPSNGVSSERVNCRTSGGWWPPGGPTPHGRTTRRRPHPPWQSPHRYGDDVRRRVCAVAGFRQAVALPSVRAQGRDSGRCWQR
ncbi:hypothetical protein SHJG_7227 [Streptomyces hygroscopicus subsp. jinggangensis 5008]|nr:hypothetical protein SHJG_7227 [Streptomyces hygroscopicus subsp. jinggangensis 5008]AGF66649.1 hypothetical protein SHJGH_6987 [Streptomyces hygroscopicus subsp. jinggangensis TL01]